MSNSKISLGLGILPASELPPVVYGELSAVYKAVQNLLDGVSRYSGIDAPESNTWKDLTYADTLLMANTSRMYPVAAVVITAGQAINLYNDTGVLKARLASASAASTMAHGIAMTSAAIGDQFEMYWLRGLVTTIGGMTLGTLYWLSPTAGAIQNLAPTVAGQIQQPVGLALTASVLLLDIPLSYRQL